MADLVGGLRDRVIIESFFNMLHDSMNALGWFDPDRQHAQMSMQAGPTPRGEQIDYNTIVVAFEDIDGTDMEVGSNALELTHVAYVDFYGEPAPPDGNGGEALAKQVIGDVYAIIVGQMPAIGRDSPHLDVLDYTLATPVYAFTVEIDTERTHTTKVHRYDQPWERNWYTCVVELIEERS